ncbi:hypothetical protein ACFLWG_02305 [Chloroflexota bacterium]
MPITGEIIQVKGWKKQHGGNVLLLKEDGTGDLLRIELPQRQSIWPGERITIYQASHVERLNQRLLF